MMGYSDEGTLALFCTAEICKTYSTFQDWKNHLHTTHGQCMEDDDPLDREEYAAGFKLDRWERFHHIKGDETDRAYLRIATLRKHYGRYRGKVQGEPPGPPSAIRIPHIKGTTPDRVCREQARGLRPGGRRDYTD